MQKKKENAKSGNIGWMQKNKKARCDNSEPNYKV